MSEKTLMGSPPSINATQTIKPVQCPVCKTFNPVGVMFCVECGLIFDRALPEDAFGAPAVRLPVLMEAGGREHPIWPGESIIGRTGDIAIEDPRISRRHAVIRSGDGSIGIEDLGSTNGTTVNGEPLAPGTTRNLSAGDRVGLGGFELTMAYPGESAKTLLGAGGRTAALDAPPVASTPVAEAVVDGVSHPLRPGRNTLGRRAENDVCIPNPFVSGTHAEIDVADEGIYFTDLGSTNGTFLNDSRLSPNVRTLVNAGDVLRIGEIAIELKKVQTP